MKENWTPIKGYEGLYEVSDKGNIRTVEGRVIRTTYRKDYLVVFLKKDGVESEMSVHGAVLSSFQPTGASKPRIRHLNNNKRDNSLSNLEYKNV